MADEMLLDRIQDLSDLELATLICLVAEEHCIIDTDAESRDKLAQELELVSFLGWRLRCKLLMAIGGCKSLRPLPRCDRLQ